MLAQCKACGAVKLDVGGRVPKWQCSLAMFDMLPDEPCAICVHKSGDRGITQSI